MTRPDISRWPCSIARALAVTGDRWTPLIMRDAFYGLTRFDQFQHSLGMSRNVLTRRLNGIVETGLLERRKYQDRPERYEYIVTEMGRDYWKVVTAMATWSDTWLSGPDGPPIVLHHDTCDHDTTTRLVCAHCNTELELEDVSATLGPGYPDKLRSAAKATGFFRDAD
jgi:DNA-binding HxlR family transcriptional regulator